MPKKETEKETTAQDEQTKKRKAALSQATKNFYKTTTLIIVALIIGYVICSIVMHKTFFEKYELAECVWSAKDDKVLSNEALQVVCARRFSQPNKTIEEVIGIT